jgi:formylglycine-generating enzyme
MGEPSPRQPPASALRSTPIGRADLVRLWAAPSKVRSTVALQMGLEREPTLTEERPPAPVAPPFPKESKAATEVGAVDEPSFSSVRPTVAPPRPPAAQTAKFYRLARVEYVDEDASRAAEELSTPDTAALVEDAQLNQLFTQSRPKAPLACGWPRIWTRLRAALLRTDAQGPLDVARLIEGLSQGRLPDRLPRLQRRRLPARVTLVLDRRAELAPLWGDESSVERALFRVLGAPPARSIWLAAGTTASDIVHGGRKRALDWQPGDALVVLSDVGLATSGFDAEGFRVASKQLRQREVKIVVLSPVPAGQHHAGAHAMCWEPDAAGPSTFEADLERLLAITSFALRVEPGLLRVLRRIVSPRGGLELELALWNHALGRHMALSWAMLPEVRSEHQARFFSLPEQLQREAMAALVAWHACLCPEILAEELSTLEARATEWGKPLPLDEALVRAALRRLKFELTSVAEGNGDIFSNDWLHRLSRRVPGALYRHPVLGETLVRALLEVSKDKPLGALSEYVGSADLAALASGAQPTSYSLTWGPDGLRSEAFAPGAADAEPRPRLHLLAAKQPRALFHARWEGEDAIPEQGLRFEWRLGDEPKQLPSGPTHFSVTTDQAAYHFERITKPPWAKSIRQDVRGLFAELELGGCRHGLLWLGSDGPAAERGCWISEPVTKEAFAALVQAERTDGNSRPAMESELTTGLDAESHKLAKVNWSRFLAWLQAANSNRLGIQLRPVGPNESPARFESEHYYPTYNSKGIRSFRFVLEERPSKGEQKQPWESATPAPDVTWAAASGRDEYGLYAEFSFRGVTQRMRWIEPGTFLMGSPKDEAKRLDNEVQHEVTLTEGYWVAETACTQGLWEVVMGPTPSHFSGRGRPVEQVSWEDCQAFLVRINRERPGLDLRLLTEAEWEYACRAGTRGPFSFGDNIAPEQVNYDGNYPYKGGAKGVYRAETVAVRTLPPNGWGLYEMHGNVSEWCADWFGPYEGEYVVDPCGPAGGEERVLRGGSWNRSARNVRSARRLALGPAYRDYFIGFRFTRGHK